MNDQTTETMDYTSKSYLICYDPISGQIITMLPCEFNKESSLLPLHVYVNEGKDLSTPQILPGDIQRIDQYLKQEQNFIANNQSYCNPSLYSQLSQSLQQQEIIWQNFKNGLPQSPTL